MPELPEVETIVRQLRTQILHKKIIKLNVFRQRQWKNIEHQEIHSLLTSQSFAGISRRAKFIILDVNNDLLLIIHLRMSGKLMWVEDHQPVNKFSRTIFCFEDGSSLQFNDTRALGTLEIIRRHDFQSRFNLLGVEPLEPEFTLNYLRQNLKKSNLEIKDFLLDQRKVVGIGNIYANEILFHSAIHPKRLAKTLDDIEIGKLYLAIPKILNAAIDHMGTTLGDKDGDYRTVYNMNGEFQTFLKVYGRKNQPCYHCGETIQRIVQKGRSSFVCVKCQK